MGKKVKQIALSSSSTSFLTETQRKGYKGNDEEESRKIR